jgi:hypothetical protein
LRDARRDAFFAASRLAADDQGEGDPFFDVSPSDATLDLSATTPYGTIIDLTVIGDVV